MKEESVSSSNKKFINLIYPKTQSGILTEKNVNIRVRCRTGWNHLNNIANTDVIYFFWQLINYETNKWIISIIKMAMVRIIMLYHSLYASSKLKIESQIFKLFHETKILRNSSD